MERVKEKIIEQIEWEINNMNRIVEEMKEKKLPYCKDYYEGRKAGLNMAVIYVKKCFYRENKNI